MPDTKISDLSLLTDPAADDMLPVADVSATETKRYPLGAMLPVAAPSGIVIDTTTFTNPITGSGKITTIVFPAETTALAIAQVGDTFPRIVLGSEQDDGLLLGPGDSAPNCIILRGPGGKLFLSNGAGGAMGTDVVIGGTDTNLGLFNEMNAPLLLQGLALTTCVGDPNTNRGGNVSDICFRQDPGGALQTIYRCTVAGTVGNATWVGIL